MTTTLSQIYSVLSNSGLVRHELVHGLIALPPSLLLYRKAHSLKYAIYVIAASYLVDLDHIVDHLIYTNFHFSVIGVITGDYFLNKRMIVPLHSWELLIIFAVLSLRSGWKSIFTALTLGLLVHFVYDAWAIGSLLKYSLIFRILRGFYMP